MVNIAINGLGRIGRLLLRRQLLQADNQIEIVAANDLVDGVNLAYLLKYDSVHGRLNSHVGFSDGHLDVGEDRIPLFQEENPEKLPWKELGVDVVIDCTGHFLKQEGSVKHLDAGAKKVLLSAPSPEADMTLVRGVNESGYNPKVHNVVSNASCTTNSLAPPLKVLLDHFGIESVMATTVHSYTISQSIVDSPASKMIRGRAGAINIIPTSTGSDVATALVLPELKNRISAMALRVPVPNGAITDITANLRKETSGEEVNQVLKEASEGSMKGILEYSEEQIVSCDIIGNPHSGIVHALSTKVVQGKAVKIQVWYDNEYGYACRLLETAHLMVGPP